MKHLLVVFCSQNDIIHQTTAPYSPQQNGVAERKNRTLKEMMNALLLSSGLPQNLWGKKFFLQIILSTEYLTRKPINPPMSCGKVEDLLSNT